MDRRLNIALYVSYLLLLIATVTNLVADLELSKFWIAERVIESLLLLFVIAVMIAQLRASGGKNRVVVFVLVVAVIVIFLNIVQVAHAAPLETANTAIAAFPLAAEPVPGWLIATILLIILVALAAIGVGLIMATLSGRLKWTPLAIGLAVAVVIVCALIVWALLAGTAHAAPIGTAHSPLAAEPLSWEIIFALGLGAIGLLGIIITLVVFRHDIADDLRYLFKRRDS